jgi:hypothetical protein
LTNFCDSSLYEAKSNSIISLSLPWTMSSWWIPWKSESELLYNWWFTANQFVLATSPFRLTTSHFIFQQNSCGYSPYLTPSLTRGWVCCLQLLLVLASAVILWSEFHWSHDRILLSQIGDSTSLEGQVPLFISLSNRMAQLYPQAQFSLFVVSYNSQGYGGGIQPRLHTGGTVSTAPYIGSARTKHRKHINWSATDILYCCQACLLDVTALVTM